MLMAVGMQPNMIGRMVWIELLGLGLFGCGLGLAIGGGITLWLQHVGVVIPGMADLLAQFGLPSRLYPALSPFSALIGPGAILLAIVIGGIVPYLRVARLTPALAMRSA